MWHASKDCCSKAGLNSVFHVTLMNKNPLTGTWYTILYVKANARHVMTLIPLKGPD